MKKTNFLKIALTLVMAFVISGAFAQFPIPGEDVVDYVSTVTEGTITVTEGTTVPLYALPDVYFSSTYDPATGTGINAGHTWTWTPPVGGEVTLAGGSANYIQATGVTAGGPYTVSVVENGACGASAATETIDVNVIETPSFSLTTPAAATYTDCEGGAGLPAVSVLATIAANGASNYRIAWDLEIYTEDNTGTPDNWYDTDGSDLGLVQAFAEQSTQASPQTVAAAGDVDITSVAGWVLQGPGTKATVYVYTLRYINDAISRKGDFLAIDAGFGTGDVTAPIASDFTYCDYAGTLGAATTDVLTITVNPAPTTGPIYHISNTWAN